MTPEFLDIDDVIEIHKLQLAEFGGLDGIRGLELLDSAMAQPKASFGGQFLHFVPLRHFDSEVLLVRRSPDPAQDAAGAWATIVPPRAFSSDFFRNSRN